MHRDEFITLFGKVIWLDEKSEQGERKLLAPIWIIVDFIEGKLSETSKEMLQDADTLAQVLRVEVWAVVIDVLTETNDKRAEQVAAYGASHLIQIRVTWLNRLTPEVQTLALVKTAESAGLPMLVVIANNHYGQEIGARLAAKWGIGFFNDCVNYAIDSSAQVRVTRAISSGQWEAVLTCEGPLIISFRPGAAGVGPALRDRKVEERLYEVVLDDTLLTQQIVRDIPVEPREVDITEADVIVAGGGGIGSKQNFRLLEEVADALRGSVAGSRIADDNGWINTERRVGLTGKTVSPKVYIAIGISGAREHTVGMSTAQTIIAINNNPRAEIFKMAHLGLVGDALEVMKALLKKPEEIV